MVVPGGHPENDIKDNFKWLLEHLQKKKSQMDKTLIFFQHTKPIIALYEWSVKELDQKGKPIEEKSNNAVKKDITAHFMKDSNLRVLLCYHHSAWG